MSAREERPVYVNLRHDPAGRGDAVTLRDLRLTEHEGPNLRDIGRPIERVSHVSIDCPIDDVATATLHLVPVDAEPDEEPLVVVVNLRTLALGGFCQYVDDERRGPEGTAAVLARLRGERA